jgi:hypothetical protein
VKIILLLLSFSVFSTSIFAAEKKSSVKRDPASIINVDTTYVQNSRAVVGCSNRACEVPSYVVTAVFFGMSEETDAVIGKLEYSKLYSCETKGGYVGSFYKVYAMSKCQELTSHKFLEGISERFGN